MELNIPSSNLKDICALIDSGFIQLVSSSYRKSLRKSITEVKKFVFEYVLTTHI